MEDYGYFYKNIEHENILPKINQNMKTNRWKDKKAYVPRSDQYDSSEIGGNCSYSKNTYEVEDVRSKGRIKIVGQLGLTQDDQYIMNCAATVNDTPIKTNIMNLDNNDNFNQDEYDDDFEPMVTQSTQVNFNFPKLFPKRDFKNKTAQCDCGVMRPMNLEMRIPKSEPENIEIKHSKSPLVVISVYPREEQFDNKYTITKSSGELEQRTQKNNIKNPNQRSPLLRSSSPRSDSPRRKEKLNILNKTERKIRSRSTSPAPSNVTKSKNKIDTKVVNTMNCRTKKISPLRQNSPDKSLRKLIDDKRADDSKRKANYLNNKTDSLRKTNVNQHRDIRETTKEQVKKAIVHTFLNNIDRNGENCFNNKILDPRKDASRITINIDGDKEKYDVFFEQQNFDTGLTVRKTVKPQSSFKMSNNKQNKKHENIPLISDFSDHYIVNQNEKNPQPSNVPKLMAAESRLNVKDSLEISHRREKRKSSQQESRQMSNGNENTNYSLHQENSPLKHYRGDNCSILDPNERDKEIRELLGILRGKIPQDRKQAEIGYPEKRDAGISCHIECARRLSTKLSFSNLFPKKPRKLKEKSQEKHEIKNNKILRSDDIDLIYKAETKETNFDHLNCDVKSTTNKELCLTEKPFLNRNVQVFLQIDHLIDRKPIILTKKQYAKVFKNTIKRTISKKLSLEKKANVKKCNAVSFGEIKSKRKVKYPKYFESAVQTKVPELQKSFKCVETQYEHFSNCQLNRPYIISTSKDKTKKPRSTRRIASSGDIQYASVTYFKNVSISSSNFGLDMKYSLKSCDVEKKKNHSSLQTIFKGHRKMPTPNLGTSRISMDSNATGGLNHVNKPQLCSGDGINKKPFLQRLITCLVMPSHETSEFKNASKKIVSLNRNSSIDSYHISTSLGALEMTSSLYDTSASFYSNHTIYSVNKKKRSFFNSVKEFLTTRRN